MAKKKYRMVFAKLDEAMADDATAQGVSVDQYQLSLKMLSVEADEIAKLQQIVAEISQPLPLTQTTT